MNRRAALWNSVGIGAFLATAGAAWILSLPPAPAGGTAPPVPQEEADAAMAALQPPKRRRPLVAIVGINDATETTKASRPRRASPPPCR